MTQIVRITLFKLPNPDVLDQALQKYSTLAQDALKDGKPYIHGASAIQLYPDPRSQGFTLLARTVFASKADMDFFDNEDGAHGGIKALIRPCLGEMPLVVYGDGK